MKKLEAVCVTAEVTPQKQMCTVGSCLRGITLTSAQRDTVLTRLVQAMQKVASMCCVAIFENSTMIWIETNVALCRRSLNREMRRFGRVLEKIGLTEKAISCTPFVVRNH